MSVVVELPPAAEADLESLFDLLLDRSEATEDLDRAQAAIDAIGTSVQQGLAITPFSFRKAAQNPAQRELIIPFGGTGYVALNEIVSPSKVVVLAMRLQREEDYHRRRSSIDARHADESFKRQTAVCSTQLADICSGDQRSLGFDSVPLRSSARVSANRFAHAGRALPAE